MEWKIGGLKISRILRHFSPHPPNLQKDSKSHLVLLLLKGIQIFLFINATGFA